MRLFDFGFIKSKIGGNPTEDLKDVADGIDSEFKTGSFASFTKTFATSIGEITIALKVAGVIGNDWTFQAEDTGGAAGTITLSTANKTLHVEIDDTSTTDDVLAGYINDDATASTIFKATSGSAGEIDTMVDAEEFSGALEEGFAADPTSNYLKATNFSARAKDEAVYPALQILDEELKGSAAALERSGSSIAVGGAAADVTRDVVLTIKDGADTPVAVETYAVVAVKVTNGDGAGADAGTPAVIDTDLDTSNGLVVKATEGEQLSPSNGAAISDAGNASLLAFAKSDGTLTVTLNKDSGNDFFFVHFILADGSVISSDEIELNHA